jgi:proline racemase
VKPNAGGLSLHTVEVHAEGEPGRIVLDADHLIKGDSMAQRLTYCRENLDDLRRLLITEPRGYPATCAVFLTSPVTESAHAGIIVLEQGGFTPMSGSNTMCAATALIDSGRVPMVEPVTTVVLDTAVGLVTAEARCENGRVVDVTVTNVPAFTVALDHPISVAGHGEVLVDVVFGGQFFVQVSADRLGVTLDPEKGRYLVELGMHVLESAREQITVVHPLEPTINTIGLIMLYEDPPAPGEPGRNTVVLPGALDRSPCGTGTCGRMAARVTRGDQVIGEEFEHRSILDTRFIGKAVATTQVGEWPAIIPQITGRTFITGRAEWVVDPQDPFPAGYMLGDIWPQSTG